MKCWGYNASGQLGDGTTTERVIASDVVGLSGGVASIEVGFNHTCAVVSGGAKCWGANYFGQLGDATTTNRPTPTNVFGLASGVAAVTAGLGHTCARTTGGGAKCWGYNRYGTVGDATIVQRLTPVDVAGLASGVAAISAGGDHTCAVASNVARCWGNNRFGQVGDGNNPNRSSPVNVLGLSSGVASVATGFVHTCALTSAGGVKCWGNNDYGQLGDGSTTDRTTAADVVGLANGVAAISLGYSHSCALTVAGGVKCWGYNGGTLGDGTSDNHSTPVDVVGLASGVVSISAGAGHNCALTAGGAVKCWGSNDRGQLGDGTFDLHFIPVDVSGLAAGVSAVNAGGFHTCALLSGGGVKCWGEGSYGALGDGSSSTSSTPVDVVGLASGIAALAGGYSHTCARTIGGGVKCWGDNSNYQLGNGSTGTSLTPSDVTGLASGIAAITAGGDHSCARTTGGGIKCWGLNIWGELGDGTKVDRSTPIDVSGFTSGATAVLAGGEHTCALTPGGGVKCWGYNLEGQLGNGELGYKTAPVLVQADDSAPLVATNGANGITSTGATLNGSVSSNGASTTVTFDYGLSIAYDNSIAATQSPLAANAINASVSVAINGLTCNTLYHFHAVGSNSAGTTNGNDATFTTAACVPTVTTSSASAVTAVGATLNGTVSSNGASTSVTFAYGETTGYGMTITASQSPLAAGAANASVTATIGSLACNKTYHFKVVGANSAGTSNGSDVTFTTAPCLPTVVTTPASGVTGSGATLNGTISGNGASTAAYFEYGLNAMTYGTPIAATQGSVAAGASNAPVSVSISGLACGTTFHFRARGANSAGTTNGADMTFATNACPVTPPSVNTIAANGITASGATLNGTLTSNGTLTNVKFHYGKTPGYGSTMLAAQNPLPANASNAPVSATISNLDCNTLYHFSAKDANGTASGSDMTFATAACVTPPPTVVTNSASGVGAATATLNGMVSSNGASTTVKFQFGSDTSYGETITAAQTPLSAVATNVPVSAALGGLGCGTTYHFRAVAANGNTANGADATFNTAPCAGTTTRLNTAPSAPLTFVATVTSNGSGKVRFADMYFPDTQLSGFACPAIPEGLPGVRATHSAVVRRWRSTVRARPHACRT